MTRKQKKVFIRIVVSALLTLLGICIPLANEVKAAVYFSAYLIIGYDILRKAVKGIFNGQLLDENFLMAVATVGAIILALNGRGDYIEAVAVMLFYQLGELFQSIAVGKSRKSIAELMNIRPEYTNIEKGGKTERVSPEMIEPGSIIIVYPGERIPIDSVVEEGESEIDTSALTGESIPRSVFSGDNVISGVINISGVLKLRTVKNFGDSAVSRILKLVENATSRKSKSENFITKFARIYTPSVCICALIIAAGIPLFLSVCGYLPMWKEWLYRGLTFLVVSCPCALVISIPLSFFSGIGGASRAGILIKGSNFMETVAKADCIVFDKTGTLTEGKFTVQKIVCENITEDEFLKYMAHAECASTHPISRSVMEAYKLPIDTECVTDIKEIRGKGVTAFVSGKRVLVGNEALMTDNFIKYRNEKNAGTTVHLSVDGEYKGYVIISDGLKSTTKSTVKELKKYGIRKTVMLTGDSETVAQTIMNEAGLTEFYSELLPEDKVNKFEEILKKQKKGKSVIYVGDGINDAPVLSRADVGIAMGAIGSQAAIEAADIVLVDDNLEKIPTLISISKKCIRIVFQNIAFAVGVKLICLILAATGITGMWLAIFADVGVMIIAVLNSMRALC